MSGDIDSRLRAAAYHEAGHAVLAYYYGCRLGPMRISAEMGYPQGQAAAYPDSPRQAEILVAGRSCAEAFGFEQTRRDTAVDDLRLAELLSEDLTDSNDDSVFDTREAGVRVTVARLFERGDFRAAAEALAEHLYEARMIKNGADVQRIIGQHLRKHDEQFRVPT